MQRLKCFRCSRKADCALMKALLETYDEWEKVNKPIIQAALESADLLLERMGSSDQV